MLTKKDAPKIFLIAAGVGAVFWAYVELKNYKWGKYKLPPDGGLHMRAWLATILGGSVVAGIALWIYKYRTRKRRGRRHSDEALYDALSPEETAIEMNTRRISRRDCSDDSSSEAGGRQGRLHSEGLRLDDPSLLNRIPFIDDSSADETDMRKNARRTSHRDDSEDSASDEGGPREISVKVEVHRDASSENAI